MKYPAPRASDVREAWDEDLPWLATRSVELGREHCTCSGFYHELRGPLRASGFLSDFKRGPQILASTISPLIKNHTRVLIAGSADTGIFSTVMQVSYEKIVDISVVDRCKAPLELIKEFAAMKGTACATLHSDIGELNGDEKWNLIILHYTSMFFDSLSRERCFQRLSRSLAPGGVMLCMDRMVKPPTGDERNEREIAWYRDARDRLRNSSYGAFWEGAELDNMLRQFVRERVARGINYVTAEEIADILTNSGLRIVSKEDGEARTTTRKAAVSKADACTISVIVAVKDE